MATEICPYCGNSKGLAYLGVDQTILKCMSCERMFDTAANYSEYASPETIPREKREKMTMKIMHLWVVQLEPSMKGPRMIAEKALEEGGIRPVGWLSNGLILIPPGREGTHTQNLIAPWAFEIIKKALEKGGKFQVEQYFPYGLRG